MALHVPVDALRIRSSSDLFDEGIGAKASDCASSLIGGAARRAKSEAVAVIHDEIAQTRRKTAMRVSPCLFVFPESDIAAAQLQACCTTSLTLRARHVGKRRGRPRFFRDYPLSRAMRFILSRS